MSEESLPETLNRWRQDPIAFAWEEFEFTPDRWQAQGLRDFADPTKKRLAFQACAGPGKSALLALCGWNFLLCYGDGVNHPNGAAVSVTGDNLKNNLWKELALWRERSRSGALRAAFEMTSESIFQRDHPQTWWMNARSWSKAANAEAQGRTLSGLHAKSVLALIDESGDIPTAVGNAAEQALANCEWGKIIQAGNPTSQSGMLYASVTKAAHLWTVTRITGDPDDPDRSPRVNVEWAREQIALHGRTNPWVQALILGQFPPSALNQLLGPDDIDTAMKRHLRPDQYQHMQKRLGIDVARFGDDATILLPRQGRYAGAAIEMRNARTTDIAARIAVVKAEWGTELDLIDATGGYAAGVVDQCLIGGIPVMEINFSGRADDPRFFNKRAEMYWRLAEWVKTGGALHPSDALRRELVAFTYTYQDGKLRLTEKDQVKKMLGGHSPDEADALAVSFAVVELPRGGVVNGWGLDTEAGTTPHDWDPFL